MEMLFASAISQSCAHLCDDFLQLASSAGRPKCPLELAVEHLPYLGDSFFPPHLTKRKCLIVSPREEPSS